MGATPVVTKSTKTGAWLLGTRGCEDGCSLFLPEEWSEEVSNKPRVHRCPDGTSANEAYYHTHFAMKN